MTQRPFRFIHAGDFHLERPLSGVAEVPDTLREVFLEAPYLAAERVFEYALAEQVDFVVLAGDLLHAEMTGPRGPLFLVSQFERLRQRGIRVYWAGGQVDPPDAWPAVVRLPDNVHRFPQERFEELLHHRGDEPVARLMGASSLRSRELRADDFNPGPSSLFTIAVAHGIADREALADLAVSMQPPVSAQPTVRYWALGGRHDRHSPSEAPYVVHYPGTPQGREPSETGDHGCTQVEVDEDGEVHLRALAADVLRWRHERVAVNAGTSHDDLARSLSECMRALVAATPGLDLLISWRIHGEGPLLPLLRRGTLAAELLATLRGQFGRGSPAAWSVSLEVAADTELPADWFRQENLLGDFLRAVADIEAASPTSPRGRIDLTAPLKARRAEGVWGEALALDDEATRRRVLARAAALGADLLSGEESLS
ncbi:MAG TPA: DNA repair exonuclease [Pirellulales bacterium]|nr:DNA repair exonuclease [Pirellulales bacterium]